MKNFSSQGVKLVRASTEDFGSSQRNPKELQNTTPLPQLDVSDYPV